MNLCNAKCFKFISRYFKTILFSRWLWKVMQNKREIRLIKYIFRIQKTPRKEKIFRINIFLDSVFALFLTLSPLYLFFQCLLKNSPQTKKRIKPRNETIRIQRRSILLHKSQTLAFMCEYANSKNWRKPEKASQWHVNKTKYARHSAY